MLSTGGDCKKYIDGDDNNDKNIEGVTKEFSVTVTMTKIYFTVTVTKKFFTVTVTKNFFTVTVTVMRIFVPGDGDGEKKT